MSNRRTFLGQLAIGALANAACRAHARSTSARVVVVGGGFAGATSARMIKAQDPAIRVTLIEPNPIYTACPLSNLVLGTGRRLSEQQFGYAGIRRAGVEVRHARAAGVDTDRRQVRLSDGERLSYDRLVLAPGIEFDWGALPGYDARAATLLPHAWQAGEQTDLLKRQVEAMPDGGLVVIAVPDNPYRCPPGPYERASLIAHYLKTGKPRSKVLILDAKDRYSKQPLFTRAWRELYGPMIEWRGRSDGAAVTSVEPKARTLVTDFDRVQADVANVIPRQRAGAIARVAGVTDRSGWCPVHPLTFESTLQPGIQVLGDACIANAMPKSAFAANVQAKLCAVQLVRSLQGKEPLATTLINTCYSLAGPDYGFSIAGVYRPGADAWLEVEGAGGSSPIDASRDFRRAEAGYAREWFATITAEVFG